MRGAVAVDGAPFTAKDTVYTPSHFCSRVHTDARFVNTVGCAGQAHPPGSNTQTGRRPGPVRRSILVRGDPAFRVTASVLRTTGDVGHWQLSLSGREWRGEFMEKDQGTRGLL